MRDNQEAIDRLRLIKKLAEEGLAIADAHDEPLIGAKFGDCVAYVDKRLAKLES